ncbi:MAG: TIGR04084 family radical SAM/SPASM domain-containing protein [Archaeoglobales archaeon]|nr:TIGR04084 family radical SAM/SPASM domain-containing protein [Archaeoglobales archaeon]
MLYIVIVTPRCNSNCIYCGGFDKDAMPEEIQYSLDDLKYFIDSVMKDKNPSIAFYGGEPLLEIEKIKNIMDKIHAEHYILQTNGLLLDKVDRDYLERFSTILISFDGRKETHEFYRGNYTKVLENVRRTRRYFNGELIARMTASKKTDIFEDVKHILSLDLFTHVHWQIDAVWSEYSDEFKRWVEFYNAGIRKLVDFWVDEIRRGIMHNIVPFLGVATAITKGYTYPPCASGKRSFVIAPDGRVLACPICPELEWNVLGDIYSGVKREIEILDPCPKCSYFKFCGARCLFFNRERLWGEEGFKLVCSTVKNLADSVLQYKEELRELKINYPKYLNTTEIIP